VSRQAWVEIVCASFSAHFLPYPIIFLKYLYSLS